MELPRHLRRDLVAHRLDERLREELVGALVELGQRGHRLERLLVGALEPVQLLGDVLEPALVEIDLVFDLAVASLDLVDLHAVQTRRQRLDRLQHRDDLRVLLLRHLAGDEDAEVADVLVQQADDHLPARLDLVGRAVDVGHPVERLLRRRDVVAHRREQDDRRLDVAQVEGLAAGSLGAGPQLVADEQVAGDPLDLLAVHQVEPAPPALELEEATRAPCRSWRTGCSTCPRTCWPDSGSRNSRPGTRRRTRRRPCPPRTTTATCRPACRRRSASGCRRRPPGRRRPSTTSARR